MSHLPIISFEGKTVVVLSPALVKSLGVAVGDVVEATEQEGQVILRSVADPARRQRIAEITREILEERRDAYRRLA